MEVVWKWMEGETFLNNKENTQNAEVVKWTLVSNQNHSMTEAHKIKGSLFGKKDKSARLCRCLFRCRLNFVTLYHWARLAGRLFCTIVLHAKSFAISRPILPTTASCAVALKQPSELLRKIICELRVDVQAACASVRSTYLSCHESCVHSTLCTTMLCKSESLWCFYFFIFMVLSNLFVLVLLALAWLCVDATNFKCVSEFQNTYGKFEMKNKNVQVHLRG